MATSNPSNPSKSTSPLFTPLEQEILDEYTLLLDNLNNVNYGLFPFSFRSLPHSHHHSPKKSLTKYLTNNNNSYPKNYPLYQNAPQAKS